MTTTTEQIAECFDCQKTYTFPDIPLAWRWAEAHQSKTGHSVSVPTDNVPRVST